MRLKLSTFPLTKMPQEAGITMHIQVHSVEFDAIEDFIAKTNVRGVTFPLMGVLPPKSGQKVLPQIHGFLRAELVTT